MKILLICLALLLVPWTALTEERTYGAVYGIVVSVYDGDTITVNVPDWPPILGEKIGVRVYGVDTREMNAGGQAAKEFVISLIPPGSRVRLYDVARDKYFRVLAKVGYNCNQFDTCVDLSQTLIAARYALPYMGGHKEDFPEDIK